MGGVQGREGEERVYMSGVGGGRSAKDECGVAMYQSLGHVVLMG